MDGGASRRRGARGHPCGPLGRHQFGLCDTIDSVIRSGRPTNSFASFVANLRCGEGRGIETGSTSELDQLLPLIADRVRHLTYPLTGALASLPLQVHATYTLDEILSGVDERTSKGGVKRIQTGVYYLKPRRCDLLFITLEKSEKELADDAVQRLCDLPHALPLGNPKQRERCRRGFSKEQRLRRAETPREDPPYLSVNCERSGRRSVDK